MSQAHIHTNTVCGNSFTELLPGHDEPSNTILLETAVASGSGLAMLVTHDQSHTMVKLSFMFDCGFSLETVLKAVQSFINSEVNL